MKLTVLIVLFFPLSAFPQWQSGKFTTIYTLYCQDKEGDECFFTISSGNTGKYFQITPCSGKVQVDTNAYATFTYKRTWNLLITATDTQLNVAKSSLKVTLRKSTAKIKLPPLIVFTP
jgi:hypothetical protein